MCVCECVFARAGLIRHHHYASALSRSASIIGLPVRRTDKRTNLHWWAPTWPRASCSGRPSERAGKQWRPASGRIHTATSRRRSAIASLPNMGANKRTGEQANKRTNGRRTRPGEHQIKGHGPERSGKLLHNSNLTSCCSPTLSLAADGRRLFLLPPPPPWPRT